MTSRLHLEETQPVIVGVGQINDRPSAPSLGCDSLQLMHKALVRAEQDAGTSLLSYIDWLGVEDQISFPNEAIHRDLAARLPETPGTVTSTGEPCGDGPIRLLNEAANLIARGDVGIAAIAGGEAMRTAAQLARTRLTGAPQALDSNPILENSRNRATSLAIRYGLLTPVDVYPLYENATRASWRLSIDVAQAETAEIWSGMSRTASENPNAWLRNEVTANEVMSVTRDNRIVTYPYTKFMIANNSVNQGAAVIMMSRKAARGLNISEERWIAVQAGAAAHENENFLLRDNYHHSPALAASIAKALEFNALDASDIDMVELYSCFPCVPKIARRILNWPLEKPHSVYGGLTFGGGPIGNCMMHAIAAMVDRLRAQGGRGLIVANGGFMTHNHTIVLSDLEKSRPVLPKPFDVQVDADALRQPIPTLLEHYTGPATIESFVVPYGRDGEPSRGVIVARNPAGERFVALVPSDDKPLLEWLTSGENEVVGEAGTAEMQGDGFVRWRS